MHQRQILIVDDEASARHSLATLLRNEGHSVAVAADAFEALALFDEAPPIVTITDLTMPGMHGFDLLLRIKRRDPQANVIVTTASSEVDSAVAAMRAGMMTIGFTSRASRLRQRR